MNPEKTIIIYDGSCNICVGGTDWLSRMDSTGKFLLMPYQDENFLKRYPAINPNDCELYMHVITPEKKIYKGADAFAEVWMRLNGWTKIIGWLMKLPVIIHIARLLYPMIAKNRYLIGGKKK